MNQYNCKNCGAPIKHSYNHHCEYCGTLIDFNVPEEEVTKVEVSKLQDLKLVDTRIDYARHELIFKFRGYDIKENTTCFERKDNIYTMSLVDMKSYINPPICYLQVTIPLIELHECGGFSCVIQRLLSAGITEEQLMRVHRDVVNAIMNNSICSL